MMTNTVNELVLAGDAALLASMQLKTKRQDKEIRLLRDIRNAAYDYIMAGDGYDQRELETLNITLAVYDKAQGDK